MLQFRFSGIVIVFCFAMFFLFLPFSAGQEVPVAGTTPAAETAATQEQVEPLKIKLSVEEIRLDVVVLDKKGNPVTDLTAADFEVFQDKKRQEIISSVYVDAKSGTVTKPSIPRKDARNLPPLPSLPTVDLKREDTRRTIIFVIDDITMSFENGYYAKMALRNFVETQMQTGDMIAVLKTGYGNSALQMFLSDKREALARIDALRLEMALTPDLDNMDLFRIYDNQLSSLSYSLSALKDMPGRKILIMMTAQTTLVTSIRPAEEIDFYAIYNERFIGLADDALRAGVVVNFLNIDGLIPVPWGVAQDTNETFTRGSGPIILGADASRNTIFESVPIGRFGGDSPRIENSMRQISLPKAKAQRSGPTTVPNPLPFRTGGVLIGDSNFFLDGVGKETGSLMKGYYLVTYMPPSGTFISGAPGDKEKYNQIKVNVKRRNVQVYTRDGFFGRLENDTAVDTPPAHPLQAAIFSPFLNADINVNIAAGYVRDASAGYLIRSWIHIDPKDVKIVDTEDGGARIELETVCLTSDTNGYVQDFKHVKHTYNIEPENKSENIAWIRKHGVRFAMLLPVKKPGSYYVRTAVHDTETGNVGSAYQFVEIPELDKKGLSLSNIFMFTGADDLKWMFSDATKGIDEGLFFPVIHAEDVGSPALRTYASGDRLQTLIMVYNAAGSEIEIQPVLYKDGAEYMRGKPILISPDEASTADGIPITHGLAIGADMPPGDYVLQLVATDKKNSNKKEGNSSQTTSFTVVEK